MTGSDISNIKFLMVTSTFPNLSENFIVAKFLLLSKRFPSLQISCDRFNKSSIEHYPELKADSEVQNKILRPLPRQNGLIPMMIYPALLLDLLITSPLVLINYFRFSITTGLLAQFKNLYMDYKILKYSPDIIHFEFGTLAVQRHYLKKVLKCRVVTSFRGYDLNISNLNNPDYFANIWKTSSMVHVLSSSLWDRALERGCPENMPHVKIPPAININQFTRSGKKPGESSSKLNLLSVGRMDWRKGYEYTFKALEKLKKLDPDFKYKIIGEGPYLEGIAFARYQCNLEEQVEILGAQSSDFIINCLNEADIFLHNALSEGFCNSVIEAQAMGVPVICSDAGGLPENILDTVTGFVVPRRDIEGILKHILILRDDSKKRKILGENGIKRARDRFNIEIQAEAFSQMYHQVLNP